MSSSEEWKARLEDLVDAAELLTEHGDYDQEESLVVYTVLDRDAALRLAEECFVTGYLAGLRVGRRTTSTG